MKTIGIIGGMSWVSSADYYRRLNQQAAERLGGLNSARLLMLSLDFAKVEAMQQAGDWQAAGAMLAAAARDLERGGAHCIILATNTMHRVADAIEGAVAAPFIHIADALAAALRRDAVRTVGLLGTRYTMEPGIYHQRLQGHGIEVLTPPAAQGEQINRIIFDELCKGDLREESRRIMADAVAQLAAAGAQGVALGCTELPLLADPDSPTPLYDTGALHCRAAADFAIGAAGKPDSSGVAGVAGALGESGAAGVAGATGAAGPAGVVSEAGAAGAVGAAGAAGVAGASGAEGPPGESGPPGATGAEGAP